MFDASLDDTDVVKQSKGSKPGRGELDEEVPQVLCEAVSPSLPARITRCWADRAERHTPVFPAPVLSHTLSGLHAQGTQNHPLFPESVELP